MKLDDNRILSLGLNPHGLVAASGTIRYAVGIIQRERERLAKIFQQHGMPEVANAILDTSDDDLVFKWRGPEVPLAVPPTPLSLPTPVPASDKP
jgi:hypothetical protein